MDTLTSLCAVESSEFLAPPSSVSKSPFVSPFKTPRQLSFPLLRPVTTPKNPDLYTEPSQKHVDVLSELYRSGHPIVTQKILSLLCPADLSKCLQVCKAWNHQVSSDAYLMTQVNSYRSECKANAENLHKTSQHVTVAPIERKALAPIATNTLHRKSVPAVFQAFSNGITHKHKTSFQCWHEADHTMKRIPKRSREPEAICGTKKSKKRLRRL